MAQQESTEKEFAIMFLFYMIFPPLGILMLVLYLVAQYRLANPLTHTQVAAAQIRQKQRKRVMKYLLILIGVCLYMYYKIM